jgi:hypothetical protein
MAAKKLFSNKNDYISRGKMRENYRQDPTFQKNILGNSRVAKILVRPESQKRVHDLLLEKARDNRVDLQDINEVARKLEQGSVEGISSAKGHLLAKELLSNNLRRSMPSKPEPSNSLKKSANISEKNSSKKAPPAFFTYRTKSRSASTDAKDDKNKYTSFYDAMQSVNRNKR